MEKPWRQNNANSNSIPCIVPAKSVVPLQWCVYLSCGPVVYVSPLEGNRTVVTSDRHFVPGHLEACSTSRVMYMLEYVFWANVSVPYAAHYKGGSISPKVDLLREKEILQ